MFTLETLSAQLNTLHQQHKAAADMAMQCLGAIGVVQNQLNALRKDELEKAEAEAKRLKELEDGKVNEQTAVEAA